MTITITEQDLLRLAPTGNRQIIRSLIGPLNKYLPQYGISTKLRVSHFMAQACWECDHFRTMTEYASGQGYEGRADLGNIYKGDGVKFKGRGIFQCTGRANYTSYGAKLGLDLVSNPTLAAIPEVSVRIACEYWKAKGLSYFADQNNGREITRRINGGYNHLSQRMALLAKAMTLFDVDPAPQVIVTPPVTPVAPPPVPDAPQPAAPVAPAPTPPALQEEVPDAPIAAEESKPWYKSTEQVTGAAVAGTGVLAALKDFVTSQYGFYTLVFLVVVGGGVYWIYKRRERDKREKPIIKTIDPALLPEPPL
jgi:putative chitinase